MPTIRNTATGGVNRPFVESRLFYLFLSVCAFWWTTSHAAISTTWTPTHLSDAPPLEADENSILDRRSLQAQTPRNVTLQVQSTVDFIPLTSDLCYPVSTNMCNLRAAWSTCTSVFTTNQTLCIIALPLNANLTMNSTLATFQLQDTSNIWIQGNNAIISSDSKTSGGSSSSTASSTPVGSPFPYVTGTMTSTNSAQVNYKTACTNACKGDILTFSACGASTSQDTYFRLYLNTVQVAFNDDSCGAASKITHEVTATGCNSFCLRIGCYGSSTCTTTVTATITKIPSIRSQNLIQYTRASTSPASFNIPSLVVQDVTVKNYGNLALNGSAFSFVGSSYLTLKSVTVMQGVALVGGGIYVCNNMGGWIVMNNVQVVQTLSMRVGAAMHLETVANATLTNLAVRNTTSNQAAGAYSFVNLVTYSYMNNLSAKNIYAKDRGAAFYMTIIRNGTFSNFSSLNATAGYDGGAYFMNNITNAIFTNISSIKSFTDEYGGAYCIMKLNNVTLRNVTAVNATAKGIGGAYYFTTSNNVVVDGMSAINASTVDYDGGGFYLNEFTNVSLSNLFAQNSSAYDGGGFYMSGFTNASFSNITAINCSAVFYGGMYLSNLQHGSVNTVFMKNCTSRRYGGGAYFGSAVNVSFANLRSEDCYAGDDGGGFFISATNASLTNMTTNRCFAKGSGGGLLLSATNMVVTNVTFLNSYSMYNGGGLAVTSATNVSIANVNITNAVADDSGGGLYVGTGTKVNMSQVVVSNATANTLFGGCVVLLSLQQSRVQDVHVDRCTTLRSGGGAVYINGGNTVAITRWNITNSHANDTGGGIMMENTKVIVFTNVTIAQCTSISTDGGGMYIKTSTNVTLAQSTITNSAAMQGLGGGLCASRTKYLTISRSNFSLNQASTGGGVFLDGTTLTGFVESNATDNQATDGAGIYLSSDNFGFLALDAETYQARQVVETVHPYSYQGSNTLTTKVTSVNNKLAVGWYILFDSNTNLTGYNSFFTNKQGTVVLTLDTDCEDLKSFVICQEVAYPGITAPILYIPGNGFNYTLTTNFNMDGYCMGCYGLRFVAYPVLSRFTSALTAGVNIQRNTALKDGGGLELAFQNQFALLMNMQVVENTAQGNAAGLYMLTGNDGSILYNVQILNNSCGNQGGGMNIFATHFGVHGDRITLQNNQAKEGGGGLYLGAGNGGLYGPFDTTSNYIQFNNWTVADNAAPVGGGLFVDNTNLVTLQFFDMKQNHATNAGGALYISGVNWLVMNDSTIQHNTADVTGGGVYVDHKNVLSLSNVVLQGNTASTGDGGGFIAHSINQVTMTRSTIVYNQAGGVGGGIYGSQSSQYQISDCDIQYNTASKAGGGVYVTSGCELNFTGVNDISGNTALDAGGGMVVNAAKLWHVARNGSSLVMANNVAARGSAVFFKQLLHSSNSLQNLTLSYNQALIGGTIFWVYDDTMRTPPLGMDTVVYVANVAPYGLQGATQGVQLVVPAVIEVTAYQEVISPSIVVHMLDYYDTKIPLNGSTTVDVALNTDYPAQCFGYPSNLVESTQTQNGIPFDQGNAVFADLQAFCAPEGNFSISFLASLGNLDGISTDLTAGYVLLESSLVTFRACRAGEYLSTKGECILCPDGKYSFAEGEVTCSSCSGMTGVSTCYGNQLVVENGYWRRYDSNVAILSCPLEGACLGGNVTGEALCADGYSGALCAVCAAGYYLESGQCTSCTASSSGLFSPVFVVIITLLCVVAAVVIAAVWIFYVYLRPSSHVAQPHAPAVVVAMQSLDAVEAATPSGTASPTSSLAPEPTILFGYPVTIQNQKLIDLLVTIELYYLWTKTRYTQAMTQVKIVMSTYQIAMAAASVLSVALPTSFMQFSNALSFVNVNISSVLPINCAADYTFIDQLIIATLTPILLAILFVIMFLIEYSVERYRIQRNTQRQKGDKQRAFDRIKDTYLNYLLCLSYLVLPSITTMIFQTFLCTNIDPNQENSGSDDFYLTADMSISCTSSYYYSGLAYAIVMVFLYPVGIPLSYFLLLYYNREEIQNRKINNAIILPSTALRSNTTTPSTKASSSNNNTNNSTIAIEADGKEVVQNPLFGKEVSDSDSSCGPATDALKETSAAQEAADKSAPTPKEQKYLSAQVTRVAFLWQAYQPQYWYWEIIETTRRLMLTAVLSVCGPGTSDQTVFSVLLALVYIKLYGYFTPYDNGNNNVLAEVGQFQIFFTFFGSMIVQANLLSAQFQNLVGVGLIAANLGIVVTIAYFQYLNSNKTLAKQKELQIKIQLQLESGKADAQSNNITTSGSSGWMGSFFAGSSHGRTKFEQPSADKSTVSDNQAIEMADMSSSNIANAKQ